MSDEKISHDELTEKIRSWIAPGVDVKDAVDGVAAYLRGPQARPIERDLLDRKTLYAWSNEDAPIVEPALRVAGELVAGGFLNPTFVGVTLYELVTYLIRLRRNRARLTDPGQIAVLLALRDGPKGGMSATKITEVLTKSAPAPLSDVDAVEKVLDVLSTSDNEGRPHALVKCTGNLWSSLV
jgi:hypothetical protein